MAALTAAMTLSLACVPASAAEGSRIDEQYVVEEDGQTVVYGISYVEPGDAVAEQTVTWYDARGTKYVVTYKVKPQSDPFEMKAIWYDAAGNKYVLDQSSQTVTVYDAAGNVIEVRPA